MNGSDSADLKKNKVANRLAAARRRDWRLRRVLTVWLESADGRAAWVLVSVVVLDSDDIVQIAHAAPSQREAFAQLIARLCTHFESDVSMLHVGAAYPVTRCGPVASVGFDAQRMHALAERWPLYVRELDALRQHADRHGPVVKEADVFSPSALREKAYHRELSAPVPRTIELAKATCCEHGTPSQECRWRCRDANFGRQRALSLLDEPSAEERALSLPRFRGHRKMD